MPRPGRSAAADSHPAHSGCTGTTSVSTVPVRRGCSCTPKFGHGQVELQAGRDEIGPERVVDRHLDIVGLAPAGDLRGFGEPAGDAQVDPRVVDPLFLDQLAELPLRAKLLAGRQRHVVRGRNVLNESGVLAAQRVFDEERPERLDLLAQPDRIGQVQPGVDIEGQLDLVADRLAHGLELLDRRLHRLARLQDLARPAASPSAQTSSPPALSFRHDLTSSDYIHAVAGVVRVAHNLVAHAPAQQLVDRHAQRLALDIPQRDIDRRDGRREDALGGEEAAARHRCHRCSMRNGSLPISNGLKVLNRADHRQLAAGDAGFANAIDPFIGIDHHEQEVAVPTPDRVGFDIW